MDRRKAVFADLPSIVDPRHSALLILDMQNDFCAPGGKVFDAVGSQGEAVRSIIPGLQRMLEAAGQHGLLIVYVQTTHLQGGIDESPAYLYSLLKKGMRRANEPNVLEGSWGHQVIEELKPAPDDMVVKKFSFDAFHNSLLDQVLRNYGIRTLICGGESTYGAVLTTARTAFCRGYYVVVLEDCVAGHDEALHRASLQLLKEELVPSKEIIQLWAGH